MIDLTPTISPLLSFEEEVVLPPLFSDTPAQTVGGFQAAPTELRQGNISIQGLQERILIGAASAPLTGIGIFIGNDGAASTGYDFRAGDPSGSYIHWDASLATLTVVGTITATAGTIGGFSIGTDYIKDVADSFGLASTVTGSDDVRFWAGSTFANRATAPARITEAGAATFSNVTITGGAMSGTPISAIPNNSSTDISLLEATHDLAFSVNSKAQINWAAGTITLSNGRTFSISLGNTGTMAARTYVYLDTGTSSTVLQTTTTVATAIGPNKKLIAVCQNGSAQAQYTVYGGIGGLKLPASGTSVSNNNWIYSAAFSVTDADTIAWAAGTLTTSDGGSYSISGSNTGNMAAKTYIYFDLGVSSTAFQTTTTAATAIGDGKILIAIAQNNTAEASYMLMNSDQINIDAARIIAGSITANEIAAGTITAAKMNVSQLSAIAADLGAITAGTIVMPNTGYIRGGATAYLTGVGFFLGYETAAYKFSVGDPSGRYIAWDGSALTINGFVQTGIGTFGGDGSDGALSIASGTTTINLGGASIVTKNYTSISITGTGKLAFSNPAATGTTIYLKSQGNVTLTSSTIPNIDASGMGAAGGSAGTAGGASPGAGGAGGDGTTALGIFDDNSHHGTAGAGSNGASADTTGGTGGAILTNINLYTRNTNALARRMLGVAPGNGGGGGAGGGKLVTAELAATGAGGAGGNGGAGLVIECRGALNFTSTLGISVAGAAGANGSNGTATTGFKSASGGGGGGGGSGGFCLVLYNTLTAATGTINCAGGAGGNGGNATGGNPGGAADGGGGAGGAGAGGDAGAGGAGGNGKCTNGGAGGNGSNGTAAAGRRAGGGGGGGASVNNSEAGSTTHTGGTGGAAGAGEDILKAQNVYFG